MNEDRWLSVEEIAAYLGVKRDTAENPKLGRLWKFRKNEVDQWVCDGGGINSAQDSLLLILPVFGDKYSEVHG